MNRSEFRALALVRSGDARVLLDARRWDGTYYLAGYVIECALKACIAKTFRKGNIPQKGDVDKIYVHNLKVLLKLADLERALEAAMQADQQLEVAWSNVSRWTETSRYERRRTAAEARDLFEAVTDPAHGMLQWIQRSW